MSTKACKYQGLPISFQFPDCTCHWPQAACSGLSGPFWRCSPQSPSIGRSRNGRQAAALIFGFAYMLLAGSGAATQRSYIMLAVVFLAIIVDRPAISLRNLALAALLILILQPESAIQASFQMSFMAVMGLAAFFEYWNRPKTGARVSDRKPENLLCAKILQDRLGLNPHNTDSRQLLFNSRRLSFRQAGALRRSGQWLGHSRDQPRRDALCRAERCVDASGS